MYGCICVKKKRVAFCHSLNLHFLDLIKKKETVTQR